MKKLVIIALAAVVAFPAFAQQKPLTLMAQETVSYDDNIYLKKGNDKKDSFISTTRVGADYKAQLPASGLTLHGTALVGYNAYTEKPSKNNYWDALGKAELYNKQFKIGDQILYTADPANNAQTDREKRMNNKGYISYVTSTEKMFGLGLLAEDVYDHYDSTRMNYLNRNRVNLGAQLYYNMTAKTNFFVEYLFSTIDYKTNRNSDSTGNRLGAGVNGQISSKVTGTAKVTYDMRNYNHDLQNAKNNVDLVGYYAELEWTPSTKNKIRLSGERALQETLWASNRYFKDTTIALYGAQKLTDKLTASLTLMWDLMDYDSQVNGKKRSDDVYSIRPQVDYQFKEWLSAGVWYQYRTRTSNFDKGNMDYEYENNKAGIFVKALF